MEAAGGGAAPDCIGLHDFSGQLGEQRVHFHAMRLQDSLFLWVGAAPALSSLAVAMCNPRVSVCPRPRTARCRSVAQPALCFARRTACPCPPPCWGTPPTPPPPAWPSAWVRARHWDCGTELSPWVGTGGRRGAPCVGRGLCGAGRGGPPSCRAGVLLGDGCSITGSQNIPSRKRPTRAIESCSRLCLRALSKHS